VLRQSPKCELWLISPRYYHIARNMRGRSYSSDAIRQVLIRRGLSWEKSFQVIEMLDREAASDNPPHPFTPRNRYQARRRIFACCLALAGGWLLVMLDVAGMTSGLLSGAGLVLMMASVLALFIYTIGYIMFWL
jgi:hypothetical protein